MLRLCATGVLWRMPFSRRFSMSQAFSHFHPNPGWFSDQTGDSSSHPSHWHHDQSGQERPAPFITIVGKHCILELYDCDRARLDDEDFLRLAIGNAALRAGATLLQLISHRFHPHGVTGLALLAESHISIHTWPESGYAAVDVFTCGDHTMPETACRVLVDEFRAQGHRLRSFRRETPDMIAALEREPAGPAD